MKRPSLLSITLLASIITVVLAQAVQSAFALTYQPGVRPGDWWEYGDVTGYCLNPCQVLGLTSDLNVVTVITRVTDVTGANVSVTTTITYNNGTSKMNSYAGDLSTGMGNLPDGIALIAANLSAGDPIFGSAFAPTLNATILATDSIYHQITFWTEGDANGINDGWDQANGGIPASQVVAVYQYTLPPPGSPSARYDTHRYPSLGDSQSKTFTIHVNATDDAGLTTTQTFSEKIVDRAPVLSMQTPIPIAAPIGQTVTISFSATDPDGRVVSFSVNWGDGSPTDTLPASATSDTHSYDRAGTFTITVSATDNSGSSSDVSDIPFAVMAPASAAPTILGLDPTEFYLSIGIVAVMIVAATLVVFKRITSADQT